MSPCGGACELIESHLNCGIELELALAYEAHCCYETYVDFLSFECMPEQATLHSAVTLAREH